MAEITYAIEPAGECLIAWGTLCNGQRVAVAHISELNSQNPMISWNMDGLGWNGTKAVVKLIEPAIHNWWIEHEVLEQVPFESLVVGDEFYFIYSEKARPRIIGPCTVTETGQYPKYHKGDWKTNGRYIGGEVVVWRG